MLLNGEAWGKIHPWETIDIMSHAVHFCVICCSCLSFGSKATL